MNYAPPVHLLSIDSSSTMADIIADPGSGYSHLRRFINHPTIASLLSSKKHRYDNIRSVVSLQTTLS